MSLMLILIEKILLKDQISPPFNIPFYVYSLVPTLPNDSLCQ